MSDIYIYAMDAKTFKEALTRNQKRLIAVLKSQEVKPVDDIKLFRVLIPPKYQDVGGVHSQRYLDVPEEAARFLAHRFLWIHVGPCGPTSARPSVALKGEPFVDTTLNTMFIFDGTHWLNMITGAVAND